MAWSTTWEIVERALATWTLAMLDEAVAVGRDDTAAHLTRRSVLLRMITHEAYHVGEIAVIQGIHGRPQIDLWRPGLPHGRSRSSSPGALSRSTAKHNLAKTRSRVGRRRRRSSYGSLPRVSGGRGCGQPEE